ncbi:hypothetical protein JCM1841_000852 [Sporobolomyces salmonicolor]
MLFSRLIAPAASLVAFASLALAAQSGVDVDVSIKFPDSNPFGRVYNGRSDNLLHVRLASHAPEEITLTGVHGEYREATGKERPLRKTTHLPLQQRIPPSGKSPLIPYRFHSENKIGEVALKVWVDYEDAGRKKHTVLGYDGTVTIAEPESSWFDLELIALYVMLAGFFGGVGYLVYTAYLVPPTAKSKSKAKKQPRPTAVVAKNSEIRDSADATERPLLDEDWIPEHHLRARKAKKAAGYSSGGVTSGEESEGGRSTPSKRRGGRK